MQYLELKILSEKRNLSCWNILEITAAPFIPCNGKLVLITTGENVYFFQIWRINTKYNVLYLQGSAIPGPNHAYVKVRDTTLVPHKERLVDRPPPMPTWYPEDALETIPEELYDEKLHAFTDGTILFDESNS